MEEAKELVRQAIRGGIFNDLVSALLMIVASNYLIRTNFRVDLISRIGHRFILRVLIFAHGYFLQFK